MARASRIINSQERVDVLIGDVYGLTLRLATAPPKNQRVVEQTVGKDTLSCQLDLILDKSKNHETLLAEIKEHLDNLVG